MTRQKKKKKKKRKRRAKMMHIAPKASSLSSVEYKVVVSSFVTSCSSSGFYVACLSNFGGRRHFLNPKVI